MNLKKLENLHVALWLLKDCSWCQTWVKVGMMAALPALYLQIYFTWHTRHCAEDFVHNLAVSLWIAANVIWMLGEFFFNDGTRWLCQWFFFAGLGLLFAFHFYQYTKSMMSTMSTGSIE